MNTKRHTNSLNLNTEKHKFAINQHLTTQTLDKRFKKPMQPTPKKCLKKNLTSNNNHLTKTYTDHNPKWTRKKIEFRFLTPFVNPKSKKYSKNIRNTIKIL